MVNIVEGATAIFGFAAIRLEFGLLVSKQPRKKLVDVHIAKVKKINKKSVV